MKLTVQVILIFIGLASAQFDPHWLPGRSGIVHLFEWKWSDIARECEDYLAPNGFAGVQISPPTENTAIYLEWLSTKRPWWERYQPISYQLNTRSGSESAFVDMTRRCNAVGVRIYADILLNHMSATSGGGTGSSIGTVNVSANFIDFPSVPFTTNDFNPYCSLDWNSQASIRDCWLVGLPDLNLSQQNVQTHQIALLNHLIDLGVAGFRFDAMKHMWPKDLENILGQMKNLNQNYGFAANSRPFVVGEVIQGDGIYYSHYTHLGAVTVFEACRVLGQHIRGHANVGELRNFANMFGVQSKEALIFVDNHDNQRDGGQPLTNFREPRIYKAATAFHLAYGFGHPRLMSSFEFNNRDQGPPADAGFNIISPTFDATGQCNNGWVCEHRWEPIRNMIAFRNAVGSAPVDNWWEGWSQIAFGRGSRGFFVLNSRDNGEGLSERIYTGLAAGSYCDMATGVRQGTHCTGATVTVGSDGYAQFELERNSKEMFISIHVDAKL